jgi:hypothetical protein
MVTELEFSALQPISGVQNLFLIQIAIEIGFRVSDVSFASARDLSDLLPPSPLRYVDLETR